MGSIMGNIMDLQHGAEAGWDVQLVNVSIKHQPVGVHKQYWNVVAIDNM